MRESIARAVSSSGSAIVFAGCTVVIALVSLAGGGHPARDVARVASAIAVLAAVLGCDHAAARRSCSVWSATGSNRLRVPAFLQLGREPRREGGGDAGRVGVVAASVARGGGLACSCSPR